MKMFRRKPATHTKITVTKKSRNPVVARGWDGSPVRWRIPGPHTVVAGATRSGKSVFSYVVLSQLARLPFVQVVGVDPSGLLLAPFVDAGEEHIALGTSVDDLNAAVDVLTWTETEMDARIRRLRKLGTDKLVDFTEDMPVLVVVLEEYAGLIAAMEGVDKKKVNEVKRIVGRLLREGAKAGITCFTILQRPEANILHDRTQYARRVSFRLDNNDSVTMLAEAATDHEQGRILELTPGRALFMESGDPSLFITAPEMDYCEYRRRVLDAKRGEVNG